MTRALIAALVGCASASIGCGNDTCRINAIRHVVVDVSAGSTNAYNFGTCVEAGQCAALCREAALEMAPYDVGVTDCRRVDSDAGSAGPGERVTLDITYREYVFCGA